MKTAGDKFLRRTINPKKLRQARKLRGWSIMDLVFQLYDRGLRVSPQNICQWESGYTTPTVKRFRLLVEVLGQNETFFDAQEK